ncbi:hypothetical protein PVAND_003769 [Polypedilum vanderplanki]|uniref:Uncharacterized protein n=1 Tax=Polypedilum vanderplanki TaxID=319348 RepID=A0A9J6BW54_POLVA|nr:hypothetical protein PVAND_003769 [Polypedilum vanderplanki]
MPSSDPLPPKENAIFRKILKCYEMKQYKNGLKLSKQILTNPKYTEHGETLAMKGLTLNCLGRKEEAYDHVRRGLRNDLRSHVCWHVYGLLQRSDKKYDEAIKCYRNALKWEKDNIQILRDLSLLQIQMGDLEGYRETRHQLFKLRPSQHASWIGFAMSYHLLNDFEMANSILETFRTSQSVESFDYKHSEFLLYQNQVIQESGDLDKAFKHLEEHQGQILDKIAVKETMGKISLKLKYFDKTVSIFMDLIRRNPDNSEYFKLYLEARQITDAESIINFYNEMSKEYPSSLCVKRLPLDVATGNVFEELITEYLKRNLRKGVPPLFVNIRSLYRDSQKVATIEKLTLEFVANLNSTGHFTKDDSSNGIPQEPASALLWTYYYLAQHYDYLKNTVKALEYVNLAIEHTPTLIELFVIKGKIYKHAGDVEEAYKWLDEAQSLDTADRYINSKCAKYMLRANKIKEAEEMCAKFTRDGVSAMENLNEMQCMWFQTESAMAYQRMNQLGEALKKCHEIERHFSEIIEDQFDFHTYCVRKMTLRSYVDLLRLETRLRDHPFYFKAAKCAIEVYIKLFDEPLKESSTAEEANLENLSPAELKKMRNKQRKAKKKAEVESAQAAKAEKKKEQYNKSKQQQNQDNGDPEAPLLDELIPEKLERTEDPLGKAIEFLKPLQLLSKNLIETHLMTFEVYSRKNKILIMLKALKKAYAIDPESAALHKCLIKFTKLLEQTLKDADEIMKQVLLHEITNELPILQKKPVEINEDFLSRHKHRADALIAAAEIYYDQSDDNQSKAIDLLKSAFKLGDMSLEHALLAYNLLFVEGKLGELNQEVKLEFKKLFNDKYPFVPCFKLESL